MQFTPSTNPKKFIAQLDKFQPKFHTQDSSFKPATPGRGRGFKFFSYCNKPCHTIEVCFKKHGLPTYLKKMDLTQTTEVQSDNITTDPL